MSPTVFFSVGDYGREGRGCRVKRAQEKKVKRKELDILRLAHRNGANGFRWKLERSGYRVVIFFLDGESHVPRLADGHGKGESTTTTYSLP